MRKKAAIRFFVFGGLVAALVSLLVLRPHSLAGLALMLRPLSVTHVAPGLIPPPVVVRLTVTNAAPRVFPGTGGVLFILPDGSLWRWGQTCAQGFSRAPVPEQVGTDRDWLEAVAASGHFVAVRQDGTLWTWGNDVGAPPRSPAWIPSPRQVGADHDWVSVAAGDAHSIALRKEGTVWAWGDDSDGRMGNGLVTVGRRTNLVQVGTNRTWTAVHGRGSYTLALRADGTLWAWGRVYQFLDGQLGAVFSVPTQVCRETNWVSLEGELVLNSRGELWRVFHAPPDAAAPVGATCQLFVTHCVPGRFAWAGWEFYQLHEDGTLWKTKLSYSGGLSFRPANTWRRVGKRSDWVSLWGGSGTGLGLTDDGMVWMWAADPGQEWVITLDSRIGLLKNRAEGWLGMATNSLGLGSTPPVQAEPRPLLRMVVGEPITPAR